MIYFDNAATTYPKPRAVPEAMIGCMQSAGGNPGRSGHALSLAAGQVVYTCREELGAFFGAGPEQVVFAMNATQALNYAIKGMARQGCHILISDLEHNAVRRAVASLREKGASFSTFPTEPCDPDSICTAIARRLRPRTSMVVCTHASNICSTRLPIAAIGRFCRERGLKLIVDASQSAGSERLDIAKIGADAICAPGHKGLYGPQGVGFCVFSSRYLGENGRALATCIEGGSGVDSAPLAMPDFLPERMEAGTLPTPALAGLTAALRAVRQVGEEAIFRHECRLAARMTEQIAEMTHWKLYRPQERGGIVLMRHARLDAESVATRLDQNGICVRSGLHCAPLAHQTLGTPKDGAVRISFSMYNTEDEVDRVCAVLRDMESK